MHGCLMLAVCKNGLMVLTVIWGCLVSEITGLISCTDKI